MRRTNREKDSLVVRPQPLLNRRIDARDPNSEDYRKLSECLRKRESAVWGDVVDLFWRVIASTVIKVLRRYGSAEPERVDETIQEVYVRLCADNYRSLRRSRAEAPSQLFGLVQAIATTTTLDLYRVSAAKKHGGDVEFVPIDVGLLSGQPDVRPQELLEREHLFDQIDRRLQELAGSERERQIFWLYYRQGFTAKEIAAIDAFRLTPEGVESVLHRLKSELRRVFGKESPHSKGEPL